MPGTASDRPAHVLNGLDQAHMASPNALIGAAMASRSCRGRGYRRLMIIVESYLFDMMYRNTR